MGLLGRLCCGLGMMYLCRSNGDSYQDFLGFLGNAGGLIAVQLGKWVYLRSDLTPCPGVSMDENMQSPLSNAFGDHIYNCHAHPCHHSAGNICTSNSIPSCYPNKETTRACSPKAHHEFVNRSVVQTPYPKQIFKHSNIAQIIHTTASPRASTHCDPKPLIFLLPPIYITNHTSATTSPQQ